MDDPTDQSTKDSPRFSREETDALIRIATESAIKAVQDQMTTSMKNMVSTEVGKIQIPAQEPPRTTAPKLDHKGLQIQYALNLEVLEAMPKNDANAKARKLLEDRNEVLLVGDKNPKIFAALEARKQVESLKVSQPILAELMESLSKEEKSMDRKRRHSPDSQPFRQWRTARHPVLQSPSYADRQVQCQSSGLSSSFFVQSSSFQNTATISRISLPRASIVEIEAEMFAATAASADIGKSTAQKRGSVCDSGPVPSVYDSGPVPSVCDSGPVPSNKRNPIIPPLSPFVAGKIHQFKDFWLSLPLSPLIRNTILFGYSIPWTSSPPTFLAHYKNNNSALLHTEFVENEIADLLASRAIEAVPTLQRILANPLSVAENTSKLRLILDLSRLNKYVATEKVKFEDLGSVRYLLPKNGYMVTFDLKSGFHHVLMHPDSLKFLGFSWNGQKYRFRVMPFGLSSAPHLFTKILRPFVQKWREQSLGVTLYLDDGIIWGPTAADCARSAKIIKQDLENAGWTFADQKCRWVPSQRASWLGFDVDLVSYEFSPSEKRMKKAVDCVNILMKTRRPSLKQRLQLTGVLASFHLIFSDIDKRNSKYLQASVAEMQAQNLPLSHHRDKSDKEKSEILFWKQKFSSKLFASLSTPCHPVQPRTVISVDASSHSVGAVLHGDIPQRTFREIPVEFLEESSTLREIFAIKFGLESFASQIIAPVLVRCDNQSACAIFRKGSIQPKLQDLAKEIWSWAENHSLEVVVEWTPREQNTEADSASREIDFDDWRVSVGTANQVQALLGHCEIDLFANDRNSKCNQFYSRYPCPRTMGIDAFLHPTVWNSRVNLWLVPPIPLVAKVLRYAKFYGSKGILGVPEWPSQNYWPLLRAEKDWAPFIKKIVRFSVGDTIFEATPFQPKFGEKFAKSNFIFFSFDFQQ